MTLLLKLLFWFVVLLLLHSVEAAVFHYSSQFIPLFETGVPLFLYNGGSGSTLEPRLYASAALWPHTPTGYSGGMMASAAAAASGFRNAAVPTLLTEPSDVVKVTSNVVGVSAEGVQNVLNSEWTDGDIIYDNCWLVLPRHVYYRVTP
jgi:hypothetical protein